MPDFRSYCPELSQESPSITLSPDESRHLISVNRARLGDPVVVFDGLGSEWLANITLANKRKAVLEGREFRRHDPPAHTIALAQSIPKSKGFENIVRKATELGIQTMFPLISERTESKVRDDREAAKSSKWQTAAIEGAKQSGNPFLPKIYPVQTLEDFLESVSEDFALKLIASLETGSLPFHTLMENAALPSDPTGVFLVGPEGDFSTDEYARIRHAGFEPITLGPYVLKCETAAIKALSILQYEFSKATR